MWQLLAISSALFSALAAILEKKILLKSNPVSFSLIVSFLTALLSIPFLFYANLNVVTPEALLVLYIKSVLGALAFLMVMTGIQKNELSNSLPLLAATPAVVAVAAYFILNEKLSILSISGMFLLIIGTYILQLKKNGNWFSPFLFVKENKTQGYILIAIALFSITSILDKTLLKEYKVPPEIFLPVQQGFFTLNFLIVLMVKKIPWKTVTKETSVHWKLLGLVAVIAIIYRYTHILAMKAGSVALVLSIKRTSVFFATVVGGTYFKEHQLVQRAIAVLIMVAGAIVIILT